MVPILLELFICLTLGAWLGWTLPWLPTRLAQPLIHWGVPLSLAALLLRSEPSEALFRVGLLGLLVPLFSLLLLGSPPLRSQIKDPVSRLGAAVGNTGYWGLPVAVALLPPDAVATAAAYDAAGTLITWSLGPVVLQGVAGKTPKLLSLLWASPALQGLLLAAIGARTPWRPVLAELLWWPARAVFVVALSLVGMRLGLTIRQRSFEVSTSLPWALAFKLLVVPGMVWLLGQLLPLSPMELHALVLQAAAPTALAVLLMAEAEQEAVALASTQVLCSTVLAMVTVPLWWVLMR
ncbi:MAG: AEC family transporter [Cyanobium sp.]